MKMRASEAAIEAVYRSRFNAFLSTATATLADADAAMDAVQETFAVALRSRGRYRGEGALEAWIWKILVNLLRDRRRAFLKQRTVELTDVDLVAHGDAAPDAWELGHRIAHLPERQRMVLFLRYYADLSYAQIAETLDLAPGTVGATLNAAHDNLRRGAKEVNR